MFSSLEVSTIIWPGETVSGPVTRGDRTLRIVTNIVAPFVMESVAVNGKCTTAQHCLRVQTKNKEELDDIFDD